jgi:hypothetical protein
MSSFKHKSSRVKYRSDVKTLDELHNEYVSQFRDQKTNLPNTAQELSELRKKLSDLETSGKRYEPLKIKERAYLKEQISAIELKINNIKSGFDEMEYFSKTYDVILRYYDTIEGKYYNDPSIPAEEPQELPTDTDHFEMSSKLKQLNELSKKNRKEKKSVKRRGINTKKKNSKPIFFYISGDKKEQTDIEETTSNRATLQDEYLTLVDEGYICSKMVYSSIKTCADCDIEMTLIQSEGLYVCQKCGVSLYDIIESEIPSHRDASNEKPKYPYKKINHLIEKLNQFQSKETSNIPDEVFDVVDQEIYKQRLDKDDVTLEFVKKVLKKNRYNKYYENTQYIFSKVTDTPPLILTRDEEEDIKKRFRMLEEPFTKHRPIDRTNFLNYSFVLHKIFKIMGLHSHAKYFTLLKSKEKLKLQDKIWEKICNDLGWPFHSSKSNDKEYKMRF